MGLLQAKMKKKRKPKTSMIPAFGNEWRMKMKLQLLKKALWRDIEQEPPSKKETRKNAVSHDDQIADELAKEDSEDD